MTTVLGVGGIGHGVVMALRGNHDLGREESRAAQLLPVRDYCKLHIIFHYVAHLLDDASVMPIGAVGQDDAGARLIAEMAGAGMDTTLVRRLDLPTKYSVCYLYPDGSGGNLTTDNDAGDAITPEWVEQAMAGVDGPVVGLAAPEVPIAVREALLRGVAARGGWSVGCFTAGEADEFAPLVPLCDVLCVNAGEAQAAGGAAALHATMCAGQGRGILTVTDGGRPLSVMTREGVQQIPVPSQTIVSTAGAGDAFCGGFLSALIAGLPVDQAARWGIATAGFAVTRPDSIALDFSKEVVK